ncbi:MAG: hypothetical protein M1816_005810 [Peltula sp. TS41687]|nr:MAG: hypothetical protein M1816_005810 [Peltula sp. TS41687]
MSDGAGSLRRPGLQSRPTFLARVARDDAAQLNGRSSSDQLPRSRELSNSDLEGGIGPEQTENPSASHKLIGSLRRTIFRKPFAHHEDESQGHSWTHRPESNVQSSEREPLIADNRPRIDYATNETETVQIKDESHPHKARTHPRTSDIGSKLGTFSGVFVPTSLNVLSILMFLRFGFILGQSGVVGMLAMLVVSYLINLVTTLSISAIATNGTVRGGGAYYLISRSLGPEFGGSIGVVFYLGFVLNTGMNAVGLVDCLVQNIGVESGGWYSWLPEGFWWNYLWASIILIFCTAICLAGSSAFAKASNGLLAILLVSTFSIPLSALVMRPFEDRSIGIEYTGLSLETFKGNLMPRLTRGAAGSQMHGRETFRDLFGILFPATGGIFAGASMSGDLKNPSNSIPKGTLYGLALTFFTYVIVILSLAATVTRASFYRNVNVIQYTNISDVIILLGEFATSFFSSLMGVIGSAKLLQALARDNVLPGFSMMSKGSKKKDEPIRAILITHLVAQLTMLGDINQIASFITMTYLMTFLVTNLACFLLKISSAPNFRPSFRYFNWETAFTGTLVSGIMMYFVDRFYATACVVLLVLLFLLIHYTAPPKSWGDVSQSLIYHQVRKYLLRLRQEHVKYWRPQILLLVNDPSRQYKLIQFCNSMKKGALYILGHVIVSQDFETAVPEARRQQAAWTKYIDVVKVKGFVNVTVAPSVEWGARTIVMNSGLGGMRPNIAVLGFFNHRELKKTESLVGVTNPRSSTSSSEAPFNPDPNAGEEDPVKSYRAKSRDPLPTDTCKMEDAMSITSYVTLLEDLLLRLRINVAVAKGFSDLELPSERGEHGKRYIDLWPIQMSAEIVSEGDDNPNVLTTNFDTYTLILQLGCILNTVPAWKRSCTIRIAVFVEYESDVNEERERVKSLLSNLRINAQVLVFCLASGSLQTYEIIVNGRKSLKEDQFDRLVEDTLQDEQWWQDIQRIREGGKRKSLTWDLNDTNKCSPASPLRPSPFQRKSSRESVYKSEDLTELVSRRPRRHSIGGISKLGVSLGMQTHRLPQDLIEAHPAHDSGSEASERSEDTDIFFETEEDDQVGRDDAEASVERRRGGSFNLWKMPQFKRWSSSGSAEAMSSSGRGSQRDSTTASQMAEDTSSPGPKPSRAISTPSVEHPTGPPSMNSPRGLKPPATLRDISNTTERPVSRQSAVGDFTSAPLPRCKVVSEETSGPSIMFAESTSPPLPASSSSSSTSSNRKRNRHRPRHHHQGTSPSSLPPRGRSRSPAAATGYPSIPSLPLSFNDLPCRAQHLILNELIRQQSAHTAVVFTTLPSPIRGTGQTEADSLRYLSDLEILCHALPPTLLVHSNSMTVTTNL